MFYAKVNGQASDPGSFAARARDFGASAAQGVGSAAQTAAMGVSKGVRQGVYTVRVWAAPRLESAAGYCTTTAAPKVSSALLVTARQLRPEDVTRKKGHSVLTWSILAASVLAAAGAVAAVVRYRYRTVLDVEVEEEFDVVTPAEGGTAGMPAAGAAGEPRAADSTATGTDTEVNGRVSASGW